MKRIVSLTLVCMLLFSLAACGKTQQNQSESPNTSNSGTEGTDGASGGASAAANYDSIVRVVADWPTYADPAVGNLLSDSMTMTNVYDGLVYPQTDGKPKAHIAESWDASPDGKEFTFKLRSDVKFHSGNPLTADDVVYSMNRMLEVGEGYAYLYIGTVEKVEAIDPTTVKFTLAAPFGPFVSSLIRFFIVDSKLLEQHYDTSAATYGDKGDYGKNWLLTNDAGSGPYTFEDVKLEEYILCKKFDDYFLGWDENAPEYFRISGAVEPVSVRTAMANKELEITDHAQPLENYNAMDEINGIDVLTFDTPEVMNICINTQKAPTNDIHLRKALAYTFDYDTLVTDISPGAGRTYGPVPTGLPGSTKDLDQYSFDLDKAKAELALSNYTGEPIQLVWAAELPEEEKMAMMFLAAAQKVGINIEVVKMTAGAIVTDCQQAETTPHMTFIVSATSFFEAGAVLKSRYHSGTLGTWEHMEWVNDPALDAEIEDALSTVDTEARYAKYAKIQKEINDLCPTIWAMNVVERYGYQNSYIEWEPVQLKEAGTPFMYPTGFNVNAHNMKVFLDKK